MKGFVKIFLNYFILIVLAFLFECFYSKLSLNTIYNIIENILFAIVIVCPLFFLDINRLKKYYFIISYLFFSICIYLESIYFFLFKTFFSSSAIFVALDSNVDESLEFINFYGNKIILFFSLLILITVVITLLKKGKSDYEKLLITRACKFKILSLFLGILIFLKLSTLIVYNLPYLIIKSCIEYETESEKLGNYKENINGNFNNISRLSKKDEEEIYVIIVGESTSRTHMGIYGYYRETTPELEKRKDELLIYKDVISPHAYSVGALTKILTLANYENPKKTFDGSVIQLINSVGFETYWLSNQRPIGAYESMITKICLSAKKHKFLTTTVAGESKVLDGRLLVEFNKIINNNIKKKVIFLHLMGTHHHYENRYPAKFSKYKAEPVTNFKSKESFIKINNYDNAVLYNDFLLSQVIDKLDSLNTKSFALYFSDHGEEMYDDINMAGHNEDIFSQKMFEVPFILWQSQKFRQEKELFFIEDRKYMIDDLFHSIADLVDTKSDEIDSTRSIFSKYFKERKRIIKDNIDYDEYFK